MAGKVSLGDVKSGAATLDDLMKVNALMDMQAAAERQQAEKARP